MSPSAILRVIACIAFFIAILSPIIHPPIEPIAVGLFCWCLSTLTPSNVA